MCEYRKNAYINNNNKLYVGMYNIIPSGCIIRITNNYCHRDAYIYEYIICLFRI